MDIFFNVHLLQWFYKEYIYIYLCRIAHESWTRTTEKLYKFIIRITQIYLKFHEHCSEARFHDYVGKIWNELGNVYP